MFVVLDYFFTGRISLIKRDEKSDLRISYKGLRIPILDYKALMSFLLEQLAGGWLSSPYFTNCYFSLNIFAIGGDTPSIFR